jgi:hypothetical protein
VRPVIRWRDTSPDGLAAVGNQPLGERVLDLLANIMFSADEIRHMVEIEHGFEPTEGFDERSRASTAKPKRS